MFHWFAALWQWRKRRLARVFHAHQDAEARSRVERVERLRRDAARHREQSRAARRGNAGNK